MFKSLAIMILLQVFTAACGEDLKIKTVGTRNPALSEANCASYPQIAGCSDFMDSVRKEKAFKLEEISPINSSQNEVVRLSGASFDEHLKLTIDGQDVPLVKAGDTAAFFFTPDFTSPGLKTAILKRLERSQEFKIFILADTSINPNSLSEPSQLCEGTEFMLGDGSIALGTKACGNTGSAVNCSKDGEPGCILAGETIVPSAVVTLTDGSTISVDGSLGTTFEVTLGGNRGLAAMSKQTAGTTYAFKFKQDVTGGRTLSFDSSYVFPESVTTPSLSTTANTIDSAFFYSDGTDLYYLTGWVTATGACKIPTSVAASGASASQINLSWTDTNTTEHGYEIWRSPNGSTDWTSISTTSSDVSSYISTGLLESNTYYYRVLSMCGAKYAASSVVHASTRTIAPSGFSATVASSSQISLAWTDNSIAESGYFIERSLDNSSWSSLTTTAANATGYNNSSLTDGSRYYYRLSAVSGVGNSGIVSANAITTMLAPSSLTATTISTSQIDLAWVDNSASETGYEVERKHNGTSLWSNIATTAAGATSYTDTELTADNVYYYRVRAVNAITSSAFSGTAIVPVAFTGVVLCGDAGNGCYDNSLAITNGVAVTPNSNALVYAYANGTSGEKVWREQGGSRILKATGLVEGTDDWAKALNPDGRSRSGADFTDGALGTASTLIAGRKCPSSVYIDDTHMTEANNCLYYSPEYAAQRLDAGGANTTDQTTVGSIRLAYWDAAASGKSTSASWYEGNIQTCAGKGMRLPTLYETAVSDPGGSSKPTDASPTFNAANGIPSTSGYTWTASASDNYAVHYWMWSGSSMGSAYYNVNVRVRCAL